MRVWLIAIALAALACGGDKSTGPENHPGSPFGWGFDDEGEVVVPGISPSALVRADGAVLLFQNASSTGTSTIHRSTDGLAFEAAGSTNVFAGSVSFVLFPDGFHNAYYRVNSGAGQALRVARATSTDATGWAFSTPNRFTAASIESPRVVAFPGGCRLYYMDATATTPSRIRSATAADCYTFTADSPGVFPEGGDPFVIYVGSGQWLMLYTSARTSSGLAGDRSSVWLASSADGLTWTTADAPLIVRSGESLFHPTAIDLGSGRYRVYVGTSENTPDVCCTFPAIVSGVMSR